MCHSFILEQQLLNLPLVTGLQAVAVEIQKAGGTATPIVCDVAGNTMHMDANYRIIR